MASFPYVLAGRKRLLPPGRGYALQPSDDEQPRAPRPRSAVAPRRPCPRPRAARRLCSVPGSGPLSSAL
jgi:hypothetical protein